jgi:hypothetical protein
VTVIASLADLSVTAFMVYNAAQTIGWPLTLAVWGIGVAIRWGKHIGAES